MSHVYLIHKQLTEKDFHGYMHIAEFGAYGSTQEACSSRGLPPVDWRYLAWDREPIFCRGHQCCCPRFCKMRLPSKPDSCDLLREPADRRYGRDDCERCAAGDSERLACGAGRVAVDPGCLHAGGSELPDAVGIHGRSLRTP